ncbi:MAG: DUF4159 domain-containing protein [Anaerolineae bacterium]|nr:DUF4159 domain-containing protein [Anaerolineae bacterium]
MSREEALQQFPLKKIKANNGMAVTAEVWEEAHEYHTNQQRLHALFSHGPGIISGLDVIASDPPDTSVYILPGIAVDTTGQVIVLPQPVSYDIGDEMEGLLYVLLSYGESRPRPADGAGQADGVMYVHTEFSIFARTTLPGTPVVELARVQRHSREAAFHDAENPSNPGANEIDLRFRQEVGAPRETTVAVCYLGEGDKQHGRGASYLARALNYSGRYRVLINDDVAVAPGVEKNTLIYLIGTGKFELSRGQINGLTNYVQKGHGTLLIEASNAEAAAAFKNFLSTSGFELETLLSGHRLLTEPFLFGAAPPGYETEGKPQVLVGEGVIFSTCEYGRLWQGERRSGPASREEIRAAVEWGGNIISYALERQRRAGK